MLLIFFLFSWHTLVLQYYNNGIDNIKWPLCCIYNSKYEMYFRLPFNHECGRFILFEENMCQVTCWFDSTKLISSFALFIALHTTCIILLWTIELCLSQQSVEFLSVIVRYIILYLNSTNGICHSYNLPISFLKLYLRYNCWIEIL